MLVIALTALPAAAQAPTPTQTPPQMEPKIRVEVDLVLVEATVKDKAGRVMGDLKKEDFRVYENGAEQKVTHFSRDQLPLAVALVVDLSGSIQPFLRPLRYATLTALKTLKPEDEVALFTFASDVERRVELTHDKREVSDEFENIRAAGGTNINDAVFEAAAYLHEQAPAARRVIILVSDNVPTTPGRSDHDDVVAAALEADAAVYNIKIPGRNPPMMRFAQRFAGNRLVNVKKLLEETGGEMFDIEQEGSLYVAFQTLVERLKTRYTLGYYPAGDTRDASFHRLDIRLHPTWGAKGTNYTVVAKRGYYPARPQRATR